MTQLLIEASTSSTPTKNTPKQRTRRRPVKKGDAGEENATPNDKSSNVVSINVAQLFEMHDAHSKTKKEAKKGTNAGKPRAHTTNGDSPVSKRVHQTTQHARTPTQHAHRTNTTPHHHHRAPVVRMNSSSPTNGAAFATPAYADSPLADELPMPPTFWRGSSPPTVKSAPTRMTGVELMSHFATAIVN